MRANGQERRAAPGKKNGVPVRLRLDVQEKLRFLGGFLRRPAAVGALTPSSPSLASRMVDGLDLGTADTVVELGPGTGAFTSVIRSSVSDRTTFFALELSPLFARGLESRFPDVTVYNDSAEHLRRYLERHEKENANHILCGLPWASLSLEVQDRVFEAILDGLPRGGTFTTFGYVHASWLPNAVRFRRRLREHFTRVERSAPVWSNVPPAFVYRCTR